MKRLPLLLLCLLAGLLAGCSTIASRIEEKSAVFAALDAATQEKVRHGRVELGYTVDMVYMALGRPDEIRERTSKHGQEVTWVYTTIYHEFMGTADVGYRRVYERNPQTGVVYVYLEPVYTYVYRDQVQERIRMVFRDGKVAVIEQAKP